jgi:hypothetical protein
LATTERAPRPTTRPFPSCISARFQPGHYFLVRAARPGYVAEPDKAGKRRITETGLFGLSPKQAIKWTRRVTQAQVAETLQRGHVNPDAVIEALRRSRT